MADETRGTMDRDGNNGGGDPGGAEDMEIGGLEGWGGTADRWKQAQAWQAGAESVGVRSKEEAEKMRSIAEYEDWRTPVELKGQKAEVESGGSFCQDEAGDQKNQGASMQHSGVNEGRAEEQEGTSVGRRGWRRLGGLSEDSGFSELDRTSGNTEHFELGGTSENTEHFELGGSSGNIEHFEQGGTSGVTGDLEMVGTSEDRKFRVASFSKSYYEWESFGIIRFKMYCWGHGLIKKWFLNWILIWYMHRLDFRFHSKLLTYFNLCTQVLYRTFNRNGWSKTVVHNIWSLKPQRINKYNL